MIEAHSVQNTGFPPNVDVESRARSIVELSSLSFDARHRAFLAAATSDNTRRTYRSAIRHYLTWGGLLPADEQSVIRYLMKYADSLNPRTLALRLTALSQWHLHQNFPDPASTPTVRKTLAGIQRVYGTPKQKAKALPIDDMQRIAERLADLDGLKAKRDNALLQLGYFGAFRRSEIVSLDVEDVAWEREGIVITLPYSKTDQQGHAGTTVDFQPGRGHRAARPALCALGSQVPA